MGNHVFAECAKRGHEQIIFVHYPEAGLKGIIAVHNTVLGPALGGCRMRLYKSEDEALEDVLRLSEGMTYKNSMAGLDLGGGKSCIIADPALSTGRPEVFKKFGECMQRLGGCYITAEDMGTSVKDMEDMRTATKYVVGTLPERGGMGDPSPWTAKGVFSAMQAACERKFGSKDLKGKRVAVQGVGHVGRYLIGHLREAGAALTVCDVNDVAVREVAKEFGADVVTPDGIYDVPCDIFAPCAVGQTVSERTVPRLNCKIIAGAANNQISDPSLYSLLLKRDMLYCPDFAINSGGVICCAAELLDIPDRMGWLDKKVSEIYATTHRVLDEADRRKKFPEVVAIELAKERIEAARKRV